MAFSVVTGAFGYTGKYIARELVRRGERVVTLTSRPGYTNGFGYQLATAPLRFDDHLSLTDALRGAETLYNTYWIRFDKGQSTHSAAVENTRALLRAAQAAKVRRIVHISITNPSLDSPLPYFRGKALVEEAIRRSGIEYAILRPTVIFGQEDILINNMAFFLRHFPAFAAPKGGPYRLQPVYAEDLASLAVEAGQRAGNEIMDAVGPEIFSYDELVRMIAHAVGSRARIVKLASPLVLACAQALGCALRDVVLTRDELAGLMANLLVSSAPARGTTRFSDWLAEHSNTIGLHYASELARHYRQDKGEARATPRLSSLA